MILYFFCPLTLRIITLHCVIIIVYTAYNAYNRYMYHLRIYQCWVILVLACHNSTIIDLSESIGLLYHTIYDIVHIICLSRCSEVVLYQSQMFVQLSLPTLRWGHWYFWSHLFGGHVCHSALTVNTFTSGDVGFCYWPAGTFRCRQQSWWTQRSYRIFHVWHSFSISDG